MHDRLATCEVTLKTLCEDLGSLAVLLPTGSGADTLEQGSAYPLPTVVSVARPSLLTVLALQCRQASYMAQTWDRPVVVFASALLTASFGSTHGFFWLYSRLFPALLTTSFGSQFTTSHCPAHIVAFSAVVVIGVSIQPQNYVIICCI